MHKFFLIIVLIFPLIRPFTLSAQHRNTLNGIDTIKSHTLDEIVITSNRYGSLRINTPEAIRVIDGRSVQNFQLRTPPEALLLTPGVFIQKTNHGGGSPFIRGLTGNQTLLLIDGIRLSNATFRYGPNQYFNTIDVFSIEKTEVMRGTGSVQYGSDALGGTIQTFTHDLKTTESPLWKSSILTRIATHNMEKSIHGDVRYSYKKFAIKAGLTRRKFGDLVGGDTTGRQTPSGYSEFDYDIKGKFLLSPLSDLTIACQSVLQSNVPVYHKILLENYAVNRVYPQSRKLAYLRLNKKFTSGILNSARFTASFQKNTETRESRKNGSAVLRTENDKVNSLGFSAEAFTKKGSIWSANSGVEFYHDRVNSNRIDADPGNVTGTLKRGLYPDGATMSSFAAFSIHTFDMKNWNLTAGTRFNSFINKAVNENTGVAILTPSAIVGNVAALRKINDRSNLFISMNSGFRAPNIDDLGTLGIVDFRYETPNFDLRPERSFQYQIGYKYQDRKFRGEIYIYRNELYDLIVRNRVKGDSIEGYPVYLKENAGRSYIQGAETAWDIELDDSWLISGSLTYTYGMNITGNEPVRRIPPLFGRIAAEYRIGGWWFNIEWQAANKQNRLAAGDKEDNRIPQGGTPGWNIFNINTSYSWHLLQIDLNILNLFNTDYRFHGSGINGYGRSAVLSLIFNI